MSPFDNELSKYIIKICCFCSKSLGSKNDSSKPLCSRIKQPVSLKPNETMLDLRSLCVNTALKN